MANSDWLQKGIEAMLDWEVTSMSWVEDDRNWIVWVRKSEAGSIVNKRFFYYGRKPHFKVGDVIPLRLND